MAASVAMSMGTTMPNGALRKRSSASSERERICGGRSWRAMLDDDVDAAAGTEAREAARALACHVARAWEGHEEGKGRARAHGGS